MLCGVLPPPLPAAAVHVTVILFHHYLQLLCHHQAGLCHHCCPAVLKKKLEGGRKGEVQWVTVVWVCSLSR